MAIRERKKKSIPLLRAVSLSIFTARFLDARTSHTVNRRCRWLGVCGASPMLQSSDCSLPIGGKNWMKKKKKPFVLSSIHCDRSGTKWRGDQPSVSPEKSLPRLCVWGGGEIDKKIFKRLKINHRHRFSLSNEFIENYEFNPLRVRKFIITFLRRHCVYDFHRNNCCWRRTELFKDSDAKFLHKINDITIFFFKYL